MNSNATAPFQPEEPGLHETASEWFMRRQDASWTAQDEAELQAWLAVAPMRRTVFDGLSRTWADFADVPRPVLASDQRLAPAETPTRPQARNTAHDHGSPRGFWAGLLGHRAFVPAAVAMCVLLLVGGWYRWDNTPGYTVDVATVPGEMRRLDLPDGSHIDLNFASSLQVRYYPRRREAVLAQGEAFFEVAADGARPFTVDSGASRVTVVGTRFNVRAAPPRLVVKVLEGRVHVTPDRARPEEFVALGAAQGLEVNPDGGPHQALAPVADSVGDWRSGRLVFRRTAMAEVAQDVARYLGEPVLVQGGASLQELPVSGFADVRSPGTFLEALPDLLPVRVSRRSEGGYAIRTR